MKCEKGKHRWLLLPKCIGNIVRYSWCTKCGMLRESKLSKNDKMSRNYRVPANEGK
jgi:hypothetical protein